MARKRNTKESRIGGKYSAAALDILKSLFFRDPSEIDGGDSSNSKDLIPDNAQDDVGDITSLENTDKVDCGDLSKSEDLVPRVHDPLPTAEQDLSKSEDLVPRVPDPLPTAEQELQTETDECANQSLSDQDIFTTSLPVDNQPIDDDDDDEYCDCDDIIEEECKILGYKCELCTLDLSEHISEEYYDEYAEDDDVVLPRKLPDISVMPCGHTFHSECLDSITPEDLSRNIVGYRLFLLNTCIVHTFYRCSHFGHDRSDRREGSIELAQGPERNAGNSRDIDRFFSPFSGNSK